MNLGPRFFFEFHDPRDRAIVLETRGMHLAGYRSCGWALIASLLLPVVLAWGQNRPASRPAAVPRRAAPPTFNRGEIQGIFFENLFSDPGPLVGARPASSTVAASTARPAAGGSPSPAAPAADGPAAGTGWSRLISATTVEDEIKALSLKIAESVTTPSQFAGTGHKAAQKEFTLLAMLFAIIGEYDGDIRWKQDAPELRNRFARAAANTKAGGNVQVYNEAKLRRDDLANVIRGSSLGASEAEARASWDSVAVRSPLMRILEERSVKYLQQATASAAEFGKEPEKILHEAELVAAMADVLLKDGMVDADDDDYKGFASRMRQGAMDVVAAVKLSNADQARLAVGEITQSCSACHEVYR